MTNSKIMSQEALNDDATRASEEETKRIRAEKRAEIAARVAKAREEQVDQALMEQFVSMFVQGAKSVTEKFEKIGKNPQKVPKCTQ
jgi:hypothetical protein